VFEQKGKVAQGDYEPNHIGKKRGGKGAKGFQMRTKRCKKRSELSRGDIHLQTFRKREIKF